MTYKKPSKVTTFFQVTLCLVLALVFGVMIALPVIIKMDLMISATQYLNRH